MNEGLAVLLKNNSIEISDMEEKLYHTFLLGLFEALCKDMDPKDKKKEPIYDKERENFSKFKDKGTAAKYLISRYINCTLTDAEYQLIGTYLTAFFSKTKNNPRNKRFDDSFRKQLLSKQNHKCTICKKEIDLSNSHVDHIIQHRYVGDELKDNYQMLCETCNTRKNDSTYFEMSMLLLNRK